MLRSHTHKGSQFSFINVASDLNSIKKGALLQEHLQLYNILDTYFA